MLDNIITLWVNNKNRIAWDEMENARGEFLNGATALFTIKDSNGTALANAMNIPMTYVSGSNGLYEGISASSISLIVGAEYTIEMSAISGTDNAFRKMRAIALERTT